LSPTKKIRRFFSIDWDKLANSHQSGWIVVDIAMILLVIFNLGFIAFDFHFQFPAVQRFWQAITPGFYEWYAGFIHPNFYQIDLIFVAIFVTELTVRWGVAIKNKSHDKWFFYPFIHWYDVLGCLPLSGFRLLRFLRLFSLTYRLQRMGAIDVTSTFIYKKVNKYINILTEEISDRVVINVLNGVQEEVEKGHPVSDRIVQDVLLPRKDTLVEWLSQRVSGAVTISYDQHRTELRGYIDKVVAHSVKENNEIKTIAMIPGVGRTITTTLQHAVADITFNVVDNMMKDLASADNKRGVREITDAVFDAILERDEENKELNEMIISMVSESLEVVKQEVLVKQWLVKEQEEKERKNKERIRAELEKTFEAIAPENHNPPDR
jgi:hypothetical protein